MRLTGKTAIVTGGARGIGAAVVRALAAEGARVVVTDVLDDEGTRLADEWGDDVVFQHLDVTDEAGWQAVVAAAEREFGPVSVLVNNAGIVEFGSIEQMAPEVFRRQLEVNLVGPWLGMRAVLPSLRRAGGGSVVNISFTAGLMGYVNLSGYVASKWGLRGLTKAAALEFASDQVRVFSVHPRPIRTPMVGGMDEGTTTAGQPIPRFGEPDEVAAMVRFLVTEATYSTGSEFVVDGGVTTGPVEPVA